MPDINSFQPANLSPELLAELQHLERKLNDKLGQPVYLLAYSHKK